MIIQIIQCAVLTLFAIAAFRILRADNLFSAAFLAGTVSLLIAGLFLTFNAPDVAFTEAAVGAGLSTILFLSSIAATKYHYAYTATRKAISLITVTLTGWLIYYSMLDFPLLKESNAPAHQHVSEYYIENTLIDIGIPNVVTAVLASYRGFDTLGEVSVIFTAGVGTLVILNSLKQ